MRTVRRLFVVHLTSVTALLAAVILSFITTLGITEEIGDLGADQWWRAVAVGIARMPQAFHESLPYAIMIGSAVAFAALDKGREMAVLRASGLKIRTTAGMALQTGLLWAVAHFLVGEYLVSPAAQVERQLKLGASSSFLSAAGNIWLIDKNSYVRIGSVPLDGERLADLTVFTLDAGGDLAMMTEAESAFRTRDGWALNEVWQIERDGKWVGRKTARLAWDAGITPDIIEAFITKPRQMSARELWALTSFLDENRQESRKFKTSLWAKIAASLSIPLFMLTGLCFVSYRRQVSIGAVVGLSLLLTVCYYMLLQISLQLAASNPEVPIPAGVLGPPALWAAGVLLALRLKERK